LTLSRGHSTIHPSGADPAEAARLHADQHVGKMYLEAVQLLCNAHQEPWVLYDSNSIAAARRRYTERTPAERLEHDQLPYRPTHLNHPCSIWTRSRLANYAWLLRLAASLGDEYEHRFGKRHGTDPALAWCASHLPPLPVGRGAPFAQAMPDQYRHSDPVIAYRRYYAAEKQILKGKPATWTRRPVPEWFRQPQEVA
jgi:hypothetical protein